MLNPSISYGIHQFGGLHMPSTSTMTLLNMDSSDSISYKQKSNEDIISNLPDIIIGHILSLLPTRDAVRTCVLSKRWIYMWTFITKLDFNDQEQFKYRNYIRKKSFLNSVYRVLLHLNSSTIESISLSLSENYGPYHVNEWISALLTRRVKEICIDSKEKFDISSHSPLWKSRFLEKLIVDMNTNLTSIRWTARCDIRVIVPNFVYLLSLTVLKLSGITLSCVPSNDLQKLSLNFPALRKYETVNCTWLNVKSVTIEVPVLEVLIIKDTSVFRSDASYSVIKFCASQLAEFSYSGYMSDAISFDLSVVRIASANIYPRKCKEMSEALKWSFGYHFLRMFNNKVTCLKFEQPQVLALGVICCQNLPQFEMLSHLELDKVIGSMLWFFLLKSPFIETLTLKELLSFDHLSNLNVVPPCVASKFKVVKFERFNGDEHELHFAKFVIEKAQVLKRVSFTPVGNLCGSKFEEVKEKIFSFKESVSSAVIEFLY